MKIFVVHGIGGKEATQGSSFMEQWLQTISQTNGLPPDYFTPHFFMFDALFDAHPPSGKVYAEGLKRMVKSWVQAELEPGAKGLFDFNLKKTIDHTAGMVVQFTTDEALRKELRAKMAAELEAFKPDLVLAHSLGTLITYEFLLQEKAKNLHRDFVLVTSGCQVAHPGLKQFFGGSPQTLNVPLWANLNNPKDRVFARRSLRLQSATNFLEAQTLFTEAFINHDANHYYGHPNAVNEIWPVVLQSGKGKGLQVTAVKKAAVRAKASLPTPVSAKTKALLVGINDYPNKEDRLEGCVNDVYRMSEVLQEMGVEPAQIKVVLNERAHSANLRKMMHWLLDDAQPGDNRFFFYSGHGAQIPAADLDQESDSVDECLVTYDFDWSREHCYTDDDFAEAYSNLHFDVNFTVMLDCCHSGGMARDGGLRARGISPPDDVRHRSIKWDAKKQMWIPRNMPLSKVGFFEADKKSNAQYVGTDGNTKRFGRGVSMWSEAKAFAKAKKTYGTQGTYMPMVLEACAEKESAYEYRHGVTSFGAFTFAITTALRQYHRARTGSKGKELTYAELVKLIKKELQHLDYKQKPQVVGPKSKVNAPVPLLVNL